MTSCEIAIRVRYCETTSNGFLHPANYLAYFEQGRTELARSLGVVYRDLEDLGFFIVVTRADVRYHLPARYDDLLTLRTTVVRTTDVKIVHHYELLRDGETLAEGEVTLACVDRQGRVQRLPDVLRTNDQARELP
jgi:acyl-CoA thioester hydrolase